MLPHTSKNYKEAYARRNLLRDAQACACPAKKRGRNFVHGDGFRHKTYTGKHVTAAFGDRACGKMPHDIADTASKCGHRPSLYSRGHNILTRGGNSGSSLT